MMLSLLSGILLNPMTNDKPVPLIIGICGVSLVAIIFLFLTKKKNKK